MSVTQFSPNVKLRQHRVRRGLTQEEVASAIARVAWKEDQERVGVNGEMVGKWERGEKGTSRRYRDTCASYSAPQKRI
jgi:transcriptional regulator with XRE-family HTH domain